MKIYLIRHAQTVMNAGGHVFSGSTDTVLSQAGIAAASKLRGYSAFQSVSRVYITPLQRTRQTADLIFPEELPRTTVPELAEIDFGEYEGKSAATPEDPVVEQWKHSPLTLTFPGGDNLLERGTRALDKLREIAEASGCEEIAVISHATCIRLMLSLLITGSIEAFRRIPCDNAHCTLLEYQNGELRVRSINYIPDSR